MSFVGDFEIIKNNGVSNLDLFLVYVFGQKGDEAIIVTKCDNVFACGANRDGCLGLGNSSPARELTRVEELCGKQIIGLKSTDNLAGSNYTLALSRTGNIYSWGTNDYGTLGNATLNHCLKPKIIVALIAIDIVDIACSYHCLALTDFGEVYAWGNNGDGRVGVGTKRTLETTPKRVGTLDGQRVVAICCGRFHSLALTVDGVAYAWGNNNFGQLGYGRREDQSIPKRIDMHHNINIVKVYAGHYHTVLLSSYGDVYWFGKSKAMNGKKRFEINNDPMMMLLPIKVIDILAVPSKSVSIALSVDNKCYVWGIDDDLTPIKTVYESINEAYNECMQTKITLRPYYYD